MRAANQPRLFQRLSRASYARRNVVRPSRPASGNRALAARLPARLDSREAIVAIGMGYVGLPMAIAADAAGFQVIGFDIDPAKVMGAAIQRASLSWPGRSTPLRLSGSSSG